MRTDYLIVGQGIAGTAMAFSLLQAGKKIIVIDDWTYSSSSKVAPGLYNPVVFKRFTKSWMVDELIPVMEKFYVEMEQLLGETFLHKKNIVKLFSGNEEKDFWLKQGQKPELKKFMSDKIINDFPEGINGMGGGAMVNHSGNVEVKKMLESFRKYLLKNNLLVEKRFEYDKLMIKNDHVEYVVPQNIGNEKGDIIAKKIIFCEGHKLSENPFFKDLLLKPAKGEVLTIKTQVPISAEDRIIIKGVYILPCGNNIYKVGSTFEWEQLDELPTEKAKKGICERLEQIIKIPYEIINHEAGIRPSANDRRPLIGIHSQHKMLGIFNGLGTKGIMLAPYWAREFVEFLDGKCDLSKEVSIIRF